MSVGDWIAIILVGALGVVFAGAMLQCIVWPALCWLHEQWGYWQSERSCKRLARKEGITVVEARERLRWGR